MPASRPIAERIRVRRANPRDVNAILTCMRSAFEPYRAQYTAEAFANTVLTSEGVAERVLKMDVLVAEHSDIVAGTVACDLLGDGHGHLRGMAVNPAYQRAGVGHLLLDRAIAVFRLRGCSIVTLGTVAPLERAIRFYESHRFTRTGRVDDFFGMPLYEFQSVL